MAKAARNGALRRNFQGYTTDPARALIGFGASAISEYPQGYAQNAATTPDWRRLVQDGAVPAVRGRSLSAEDRLRRDVIESLMCRFAADVDQIARAHGRDPMDFAGEWEALADLADEGLCEIDRGRITVPEPARAAVRIVAAVFDAYLNPAFARHAVAV
jgi:oxygen-independent coproporphyrinogen-3 oxidase